MRSLFLFFVVSTLTACGAHEAGAPASEPEPTVTAPAITDGPCNALSAPTRFVARRAVPGRAPDPLGGSGALDGTWDLVDRMVHGSAAGAANAMATTWVIANDRMESVSQKDNEELPVRGASRISFEGETLTLEGGCGYSEPVDFGFDATPTGSPRELRLHRVLAAGIVEITVYAKRP